MRKKTRKILILAIKGLIAVGLLAWVLSGVHWRDYVQDRKGRTCTVLAEQRTSDGARGLRVAVGPHWSGGSEVRPEEDFVPMPSTRQVVRPGFATSLRRIHVTWALLGAAGFGAALLLAAVRWRMLLRVQDIDVSLWEAVRLTFLGQFFNSVVPGTVGGDLVKAYYVAKHTPKKAAVLMSVFVDRLVGLVGLALMAAGMLVVVLAGGLVKDFAEVRLPVFCVGAILAAVAGLLAFLFSGRFRRALRLERLYQRLPIAHHIAAAGDAMRLYVERFGSLAGVLAVTVAAHLCFVGFVALAGLSLSLPVPWHAYFVYVPLIYIIGAVPLTPGGVGWVENWYVKFFQGPHIGASVVLALALLARLIPVLWGLPGAVVAVTGARPPRAAAIEAELTAAEGHGGL